jgi:hypothetical protein
VSQPHRMLFSVPARPQSVAAARHRLSGTLRDWALPVDLDTAQLLDRQHDPSWARGSARRRASADGLEVTVTAVYPAAAWSSPVSGLMAWMVTL